MNTIENRTISSWSFSPLSDNSKGKEISMRSVAKAVAQVAKNAIASLMRLFTLGCYLLGSLALIVSLGSFAQGLITAGVIAAINSIFYFFAARNLPMYYCDFSLSAKECKRIDQFFG